MSLSDRLSNALPAGEDEATSTTDEPHKEFDAFDLYYEGEVDGKQTLFKRLKKKLGKEPSLPVAPSDHDADEQQPAFDPSVAFKPLDEVVAEADVAEDPIVAISTDGSETTLDDPDQIDDAVEAGSPASETDPEPTGGDVETPIDIEATQELNTAEPTEAESSADDAPTSTFGATPDIAQVSTGASEAAAAAVSATNLLSEKVKDEQFWSPYARTFDELKITGPKGEQLDRQRPPAAVEGAAGWELSATTAAAPAQTIEPVRKTEPEQPVETAETAETAEVSSIASPTLAELDPFALPEVEVQPARSTVVEPFSELGAPELRAPEIGAPEIGASVAVPQPAQANEVFPLHTDVSPTETFSELLSLGQDQQPSGPITGFGDAPAPPPPPDFGTTDQGDGQPEAQSGRVETMNLNDLPFASEEDPIDDGSFDYADLPYDNDPSYSESFHPARRVSDDDDSPEDPTPLASAPPPPDATIAPETAVAPVAEPKLPPPPMLDKTPTVHRPESDAGSKPKTPKAHARGGFFKRHRPATSDSVACPSCGAATHSDLVDEDAGVRHLSCDQCFKIWNQPIG